MKKKIFTGLLVAGIAAWVGLKGWIIYRLASIKFNDGLSQQ